MAKVFFKGKSVWTSIAAINLKIDDLRKYVFLWGIFAQNSRDEGPIVAIEESYLWIINQSGAGNGFGKKFLPASVALNPNNFQFLAFVCNSNWINF